MYFLFVKVFSMRWFSSPSLGGSSFPSIEPCNATLSGHQLVEDADECVYMGNEALSTSVSVYLEAPHPNLWWPQPPLHVCAFVASASLISWTLTSASSQWTLSHSFALASSSLASPHSLPNNIPAIPCTRCPRAQCTRCPRAHPVNRLSLMLDAKDTVCARYWHTSRTLPHTSRAVLSSVAAFRPRAVMWVDASFTLVFINCILKLNIQWNAPLLVCMLEPVVHVRVMIPYFYDLESLDST